MQIPCTPQCSIFSAYPQGYICTGTQFINCQHPTGKFRKYLRSLPFVPERMWVPFQLWFSKTTTQNPAWLVPNI